MSPRRFAAIALLLAGIATLPAISGCSDSKDNKGGIGPSINPLYDAWKAASLTVGPDDFIAMGMQMTLTLDQSGDYTIGVKNDLLDICTPLTDCTVTGMFTSTSTTITLDPGTADEVTLNYVITVAANTTLTLTGDINGTMATFVFGTA